MNSRKEGTATALTEYLHDVADVLGPPWRISPPLSTGETAALLGPEGGSVAISLEQRTGGERLVFETWLSSDLTAHQPHGTVRPVVTVARARPPQDVGNDLRRRLLPKVIRFFDDARDLADRRRRDATDLHSVLESVAARLGTDVKPNGTSVGIGRFGQPLFATAQVIRPLWRQGEHVVRWSIDTRPDIALALADLLSAQAADATRDNDLTTHVSWRSAASSPRRSL